MVSMKFGGEAATSLCRNGQVTLLSLCQFRTMRCAPRNPAVHHPPIGPVSQSVRDRMKSQFDQGAYYSMLEEIRREAQILLENVTELGGHL